MVEERVFLLPGEYHVTRKDSEIATLLGSCVAVCLSHVSQPVCGMNHFLLPKAPAGNKEAGRYGDTSIQTLLWLIKKLDKNITSLRARLYGGAAVVDHLGSSGKIGQENIEIARSILKKHNIPIVEEDVGGRYGRRIYFHTTRQSVTVRTVQKTAEVKALEQKRAERASRATRVLVVDDSAIVRKILCEAINQTSDMEVCGEAGDAFEARDLILSTNPDVISLDIIMPKLDGLKFLKKLSQHYPTPVVICSTIAKDGSDVAAKANEYGAVDVVDKDALQLYRGLDVVQNAYIPKLRRAAAKVVKRRMFDRYPPSPKSLRQNS